jgi:hypothetical protein
MSVLVRKHGVNCDKTNFKKVNLKEGLRSLGKTEQDIVQRVRWLNMEDIFFSGTKDYIRVINPIE